MSSTHHQQLQLDKVRDAAKTLQSAFDGLGSELQEKCAAMQAPLDVLVAAVQSLQRSMSTVEIDTTEVETPRRKKEFIVDDTGDLVGAWLNATYTTNDPSTAKGDGSTRHLNGAFDGPKSPRSKDGSVTSDALRTPAANGQDFGESSCLDQSERPGSASSFKSLTTPCKAQYARRVTRLHTNKHVHSKSMLKQLNIPPLKVSSPDFDIFATAERLGEDTLVAVAMNIFLQYAFIGCLQLDSVKLCQYVRKVQEHYLNNPYHNALHAADVLQTTHVYLSTNDVRDNFQDEELLCVLFSALVHDIGHIGISNAFLVKSNHVLATMYNDCSPLESMHASLAFALLEDPECNFFAGSAKWTAAKHSEFRKNVIEIVIGTDMKFHASITNIVRDILEDGQIDDSEVVQLFKGIVHAADLSNPMKLTGIYSNWVDRVMAEFWQQGDAEASLGMPISMMCDRNTANIAKSQIGFINFVVRPFMQELESVLPPLWLDRLEANLEHMKQLVDETQHIDNITRLAGSAWTDPGLSSPKGLIYILSQQCTYVERPRSAATHALMERCSHSILTCLENQIAALKANPVSTEGERNLRFQHFCSALLNCVVSSLVDRPASERASMLQALGWKEEFLEELTCLMTCVDAMNVFVERSFEYEAGATLSLPQFLGFASRHYKCAVDAVSSVKTCSPATLGAWRLSAPVLNSGPYSRPAAHRLHLKYSRTPQPHVLPPLDQQ